MLNPQFPDNFTVPRTGITSVDFPINAYIVGLLMYLLDTKSTAVFYAYQLSYLIVGIGFAGLLFERIAKNSIIAWAGIAFMFSSTVFIYYSHSFIPSITALSNVFIGLYFFYQFHINKLNKHLVIALCFLTLAGLTRTPFSIPIIALSIVTLLNGLGKQKPNRTLLLGVLSSFIIIGAYFIYNTFLRTNYGSMFLGSIRPANSLEVITDICKHLYEKWLFEYFSYTALILLVIFVVTVIIKKLFNRKKVLQTGSTTWLFICIYGCGVALYSLLMFTQFYHHDYYFLDTFFVITTLIFVCSLSEIIKKLNYKIASAIGLALCLLMVTETSSINQNITERRTSYSWDVYQNSIQNFIKNKSWFDGLAIPKNKKILALNAYIPNALFTVFEQQGYVLLTTSKENIKRALTWDFDYILIQDELFEKDIYNNYPDILSRLKKYAVGDGVSLYTLSQTFSTEEITSNPFRGTTILTHLVVDSILPIKAEHTFSNSTTVNLNISEPEFTIHCNTHFDLSNAQQKLYWVIEIKDDKKNSILYKAFNLKPNANTLNEEIKFVLPPSVDNNSLISIKTYFWNKHNIDSVTINDYAILVTN